MKHDFMAVKNAQSVEKDGKFTVRDKWHARKMGGRNSVMSGDCLTKRHKTHKNAHV